MFTFFVVIYKVDFELMFLYYLFIKRERSLRSKNKKVVVFFLIVWKKNQRLFFHLDNFSGIIYSEFSQTMLF